MLKESIMSKNQQEIAAKGKASEAGLLDFMLEEMDRIANDDGLMVKLSITPQTAPTPEPQPEE